MSPEPGPVPFVRVVVLNYEGGEHVLRAVASLTELAWPSDRLDLVVVDNASTDGSADAVAARFPQVRVLRQARNGGFPANNAALADLDGVDYVGLVNNDAFVTPGWLRPLVDALEADPVLGAACSKILFADRYADVELVPGRGSVLVTGARVDGEDVWGRCRADEGAWDVGPATGGEAGARALSGPASLRLPVTDGGAGAAQLRLSAAAATPVTLRTSEGERTVDAGPAPAWVEVPALGPPVDVVNNVGTELLDGGWGADRGFGQPDDGRFDEPAEVFAWCGNGVLLRPAYLRDAGLLDERFFMYYEDLDLAWRGRALGWRYRCEPASVLRHLHAASSVQGSALFRFHNTRNRLLLLTKNAPAGMAAREVARSCASVLRRLVRGAAARVRGADRGELAAARVDARALASYLRLLPGLLVDRRTLRARATTPDEAILAWARPRR